MNTSIFQKLVFLSLILVVSVSCKTKSGEIRKTMDLSGEWQFKIDSVDVGIKNSWYTSNFSESIVLPGTTDLAQKGYTTEKVNTGRLNRIHSYEGPAWYRKEVTIPGDWEGRHIQLFLERTKPSMVWIDNHFIGESKLLCSPQKYNLSNYLIPGNHTITIRIDNDRQLTPYGNVHIYSDDTQTNWNGVIGKICLEASCNTYIEDIRIKPDFKDKKMLVRVHVKNAPETGKFDVRLALVKKLGELKVRVMPVSYQVESDSVFTLKYDMSGNSQLWDDFRQPLFQLTVTIENEELNILDDKTVSFGLRDFSVKGTQFAINGRIIFLRGKNDACVFPLTGHAPMDMESWTTVFNIARAWGINHYRFHSWCPPEAAFDAADKLGMYLQVELPFWGQLMPGPVYDQLKAEGLAILKAYANHPSFVLFSMGNELSGDLTSATKLMTELKKADDRPLYSEGTNANIGYTSSPEGADFHVAARTPSAGDNPLTHARLSQAFADSRDGGLLNSIYPSTNYRFSLPVAAGNVPLIGHEVGQYQVFPDFKEIDKYTGVVKAYNLVFFKNKLQKAGMLDQNMDFHRASGALAALCYRAEIETALKTEGMAGFQLLDLQDYPGQGTALVGMLDAFMDSKGIIEPEQWRQFTNDVVPMLSFERYCWSNNERFSAIAEVSNYSKGVILAPLKWTLENDKGEVLKTGSLAVKSIKQGGLTQMGSIRFSLSDFKEPVRLNLVIQLDSTTFKNSYPLWVYPQSEVPVSKNLYVSSILNKAVMNQLESGGKVLLMPKVTSILHSSLPGLFMPDFWNYGMFRSISISNGAPLSPGTLGLLINPVHPIFNSFPTEYHTNWQWWSIIKESRALILNSMDSTYRPIVQVIDNMERDNKLGMIVEFRVGNGKLLICTSRLNEILDKPEARQLYKSLLQYVQSKEFNPTYEITPEKLKQLIGYTITK